MPLKSRQQLAKERKQQQLEEERQKRKAEYRQFLSDFGYLILMIGVAWYASWMNWWPFDNSHNGWRWIRDNPSWSFILAGVFCAFWETASSLDPILTRINHSISICTTLIIAFVLIIITIGGLTLYINTL